MFIYIIQNDSFDTIFANIAFLIDFFQVVMSW